MVKYYNEQEYNIQVVNETSKLLRTSIRQQCKMKQMIQVSYSI